MFHKKAEEEKPQFPKKRYAQLRIPKETLSDVISSFGWYVLGKARDTVCFPFRCAGKTARYSLMLCKPSTYRQAYRRMIGSEEVKK